jgi:hypothetical protein
MGVTEKAKDNAPFDSQGQQTLRTQRSAEIRKSTLRC